MFQDENGMFPSRMNNRLPVKSDTYENWIALREDAIKMKLSFKEAYESGATNAEYPALINAAQVIIDLVDARTSE